MRYTDIVKARALRRAGRACEMCGTPVGLESARFVSAHPIFGILFDQDDCCVLCGECLAELDPDTRAAAQQGPRGGVMGHEARPEPPTPIRGGADTDHDPEDPEREDAQPQRRDLQGARPLPPSAREAWLPKQDPDGGMCA
ncbi:MAG: hypothetical protein WAU69_11260 [Solirubrobacteraceae bacterium]